MKGRLGSTIWTWVAVNALVLLSVVVLAYIAGEKSRLPIASALQGEGAIFFLSAIVVAIGMAFVLMIVLGNRVIKPVKELTDFSEKLAAGDYKAKAEVDSDDDFSAIAAAFNQTSEKVSRAVLNQEAQESLQRSVTDFLTIVSQIGRGDLTLRGKVTSDALGNVVDSHNYMLDNFTRGRERVRKSAMDVAENANEILLIGKEHVRTPATC